MIRIIDATIAHIDKISTDKKNVSRFIKLLDELGVEASNDNAKNTRIYGFDNALCGDYQNTFAHLKKLYGANVEFCPGNKCGCATALAVEWLTHGNGGCVVTSFCGVGGHAATEEVVMALKVFGLRDNYKSFDFLPEMTELFCKLAKKRVRHNKAVIGKKIFYVESGVHVDGIIKNPDCYEPFAPQTVGLERKIVLGKQSGMASVRAKLVEFEACFIMRTVFIAAKRSEANADSVYRGEAKRSQCGTRNESQNQFASLINDDEQIRRILEQVKTVAVKKNGAVTDREFIKIVTGCLSC